MVVTSVFYGYITVCGIALYLCVAQWIHYCRRQVGLRQHWRNGQEQRVAIVLAVASTSVLVTMVMEIVRLYVYNEGADTVLYYTVNVLYAVSLLVMYSILWLRQRTLYSNPALSRLTNKPLRLISKYSLAVMIIIGVGLAVILCVVGDYDLSCGETCFLEMYYISLLLAPCCAQVLLLVLFLYPLIKHHKTNLVTDPRYVTLMKRVSVLTAICLTTDVTSVFVDVYIIDFVALQVNLISNLTCVILATTNWKGKLLPCYDTPHDESVHSGLKSPKTTAITFQTSSRDAIVIHEDMEGRKPQVIATTTK